MYLSFRSRQHDVKVNQVNCSIGHSANASQRSPMALVSHGALQMEVVTERKWTFRESPHESAREFDRWPSLFLPIFSPGPVSNFSHQPVLAVARQVGVQFARPRARNFRGRDSARTVANACLRPSLLCPSFVPFPDSLAWGSETASELLFLSPPVILSALSSLWLSVGVRAAPQQAPGSPHSLASGHVDPC